MTRVKLSGVLYAFILALLTTTANAATIDFGIEAPTLGTLSFAGDAAPLVGAGIDIDSIVGLGTPANAGTPISCDSCVLSFTTGAHTGNWNFGAGGEITIIGGASNGGEIVAGGETLLSGTFVSATVFDVGGGSFNFKIIGASFTDTKHADLLAYFGMPAGDYLGGLNISFRTYGLPDVGDAFDQSALFSGDIINTPVPVPASVMLFGSGLLGLVGIARRRKVKA